MRKKKVILSLVLAFVLAISSVSVFYAEDPAGDENETRVVHKAVQVTPSSVSLSRGQAYRLSYTLDSNYSGASVIWSSSDATVATVTSYGLVVGIGSGTATITAKVNDIVLPNYVYYDTCTVTVGSSGIISNGTYFIENVNAAKYVDVEGPSTSNGAKMQLWELTGATERKWTVTLGTDGYYRIKSNYSNKYMRVTGSSSSAGATITQNSSIVSGSKWSFMITSAGNYALVPASSISSLVVLNAPGTTNGYDLNTAVYSNNFDYKDEWKLTRMLPTNGSEIAYNASDWPISPYICFQYAINCQAKPWEPTTPWLLAQPGDYSHTSISGYGQNPSLITTAVSNDFQQYNLEFGTSKYFGTAQKYTACYPGNYKVALVVGQNANGEYDYHWYRQDADGLWSHKRGTTASTRLDASNKLIIDPQTANRNYLSTGGHNYSTFVGFYQLTPWNHMLTSGSYSFNVDEMSEREIAILMLISKGAVSISGQAIFKLNIGYTDILVFDCDSMEGYTVINGVRSEIDYNGLIEVIK